MCHKRKAIIYDKWVASVAKQNRVLMQTQRYHGSANVAHT